MLKDSRPQRPHLGRAVITTLLFTLTRPTPKLSSPLALHTRWLAIFKKLCSHWKRLKLGAKFKVWYTTGIKQLMWGMNGSLCKAHYVLHTYIFFLKFNSENCKQDIWNLSFLNLKHTLSNICCTNWLRNETFNFECEHSLNKAKIQISQYLRRGLNWASYPWG